MDESPYALFTKLAHEMIFNGIYRLASQIIRGMGRHSPSYSQTGTSPQNSVVLNPSKKKQKRVINMILWVSQDQGLPHEVNRSLFGISLMIMKMMNTTLAAGGLVYIVGLSTYN